MRDLRYAVRDSCNQSGCGDGIIWSYPMVPDLEKAQATLADIAGYRIFGASIALGGEPSVGEGLWVTGGYFPTLRVRPPPAYARPRFAAAAAEAEQRRRAFVV